MAHAFFVPDGATFAAQDWARGPWSNAHQHGGPPAALRRAPAQLAFASCSFSFCSFFTALASSSTSFCTIFW